MSDEPSPPQLYWPKVLPFLEGLEPQHHPVMPVPSQHYASCPPPCCSKQGPDWGKTGLYLLRIHSGHSETCIIHLVLGQVLYLYFLMKQMSCVMNNNPAKCP